MATIFRYRCRRCGAKWSLLSKRHILGPTQWHPVRYSCFKCQTFLTVPALLDRNSWDVWYKNNVFDVERNPTLADLARKIEVSLADHGKFTPVRMNLDPIICPTCPDTMSNTPFGEHLMKCPDCLEYSGESECDGCTIETI